MDDGFVRGMTPTAVSMSSGSLKNGCFRPAEAVEKSNPGDFSIERWLGESVPRQAVERCGCAKISRLWDFAAVADAVHLPGRSERDVPKWEPGRRGSRTVCRNAKCGPSNRGLTEADKKQNGGFWNCGMLVPGERTRKPIEFRHDNRNQVECPTNTEAR